MPKGGQMNKELPAKTSKKRKTPPNKDYEDRKERRRQLIKDTDKAKGTDTLTKHAERVEGTFKRDEATNSAEHAEELEPRDEAARKRKSNPSKVANSEETKRPRPTDKHTAQDVGPS